MKFKKRTLMQLADMICGNSRPEEPCHFRYRSSSFLTEFFYDCDTDYAHDGSTRNYWVADKLEAILNGPQPDARTPPSTFVRVIQTLMDQGDAVEEGPERPAALSALNAALTREGYEAFYAPDKKCYLRHLGTKAVIGDTPNPHRALSAAEQHKRDQLAAYLDRISEDEFIAEVLMPLFRHMGFHRVTAAGHKDKALEYGKDLWMKFQLPTQHVLYFGLQAKKSKLDAAGASRNGNANIAEIYNQALMMLGHEIFDPDFGKRVLVDHAIIISAGEITKAARNWLGNQLDASQRRQIVFMDRDDILNLFVVANLPLPPAAMPAAKEQKAESDFPF